MWRVKMQLSHLLSILIVVVSFNSITWAADDVPPPPIPHYMKKHNITNQSPSPAPKLVHKQPSQPLPAAELVEETKVNARKVAQQNEAENSMTEAEQLIEEANEEETPEGEDYEAPELDQASTKEEIRQKFIQDVEGEDPEALQLNESVKKVDPLESRKPSSIPKMKAGMYRFAKTCHMHSNPNTSSKKSGSVKVGRKLWVEPHNKDWVKVYKKSGAVYISRECI